MDEIAEALYALVRRVGGDVEGSLSHALWEVSSAIRERPTLLPPGSYFMFRDDDGKWKRMTGAIALRSDRSADDVVEVLDPTGEWIELNSDLVLQIGGK